VAIEIFAGRAPPPETISGALSKPRTQVIQSPRFEGGTAHPAVRSVSVTIPIAARRFSSIATAASCWSWVRL